MSRKDILSKLKRACKERKITPSTIAREIGCSPSYVCYLLSGKPRYQPSEEFVLLAEKWLERCWVCDSEWSNRKKGKVGNND